MIFQSHRADGAADTSGNMVDRVMHGLARCIVHRASEAERGCAPQSGKYAWCVPEAISFAESCNLRVPSYVTDRNTG
nr:hypothetical protein CFP56_09339 [Quercus suber]